MELRSKLSESDLSDVLASVPWNVQADFPRTIRITKDGRHVLRFTLRMPSSKDDGARRSARGRRTVAACWHVHRDVYRAIYRRDPNAVIITSLTRYNSTGDFEATFGFTYDRKVGAPIYGGYPTFGMLCEESGHWREMVRGA